MNILKHPKFEQYLDVTIDQANIEMDALIEEVLCILLEMADKCGLPPLRCVASIISELSNDFRKIPTLSAEGIQSRKMIQNIVISTVMTLRSLPQNSGTRAHNVLADGNFTNSDMVGKFNLAICAK